MFLKSPALPGFFAFSSVNCGKVTVFIISLSRETQHS
jgi:hypothetical protein